MKKNLVVVLYFFTCIQAHADNNLIMKNIVGSCSGNITIHDTKQKLKFKCEPRDNLSGFYFLFQDKGRVMFSFYIKSQDGITRIIQFSGGKDYKPSEKKYYLSVDTVRVSPDSRNINPEEFDKKTMEFDVVGSCKLNTNTITNINSLQCNSKSIKGDKFNINLRDVRII